MQMSARLPGGIHFTTVESRNGLSHLVPPFIELTTDELVGKIPQIFFGKGRRFRV